MHVLFQGTHKSFSFSAELIENYLFVDLSVRKQVWVYQEEEQSAATVLPSPCSQLHQDSSSGTAVIGQGVMGSK